MMEPKDTIVRSKIMKPALPRNFLRRDRLLTTISTMEEPLVLISASMGYGKTVLMSHFAEEYQCGWYHLNEIDNDMMVFARYFISAIESRLPAFHIKLSAYSSAEMNEVAARNLALDCVEGLYRAEAEHLRLILDDFHVVTSPLVLVFLTTLIEHLDGNLQLFICSKSAVPPAFARLVVSQRAVHISAKELAFTQEEICQLSQAVVPTKPPEMVAEALHSGLEGWPAGVMSALLHLRSSGADLDLDAIADMPHLRDYFMHELFRKLPFDLQHFLTHTAVLENLQPEVCNLLTGRSDGAAQLAYLEQENLFVIRTAGSQRVYRYHSLFRQFLTSLSRQEEQQALISRAAGYYLAKGNHRWAIEYGIQSGNGGLLQQIVEAVGQSLLDNGELDTLRHCLDRVETLLPQPSQRVCLLRGWYYQRQNQWQEAYHVAQQIVTQQGGDTLTPEGLEATCLLALIAREYQSVEESQGYLAPVLPVLRQRKQGLLLALGYQIWVYNLLDLGCVEEAKDALTALEVSNPAVAHLDWMEGLKKRCAQVPEPTQSEPTAHYLTVECFGKLQVTTTDGTQISWRTRKTKELFAYLYHRKGQSVIKEQLMDVLWPQVSPANATSLFHTSLYNIRKALQPYPAFATLICHGKGGYVMDASLVRGKRQVLDGFDTKGAVSFPSEWEPETLYGGLYLEDVEGEWCADARAHYSGVFLRAYRGFAVEAMDKGDYRRALSFLRTATAQEPYDEELAGLLIQSYTALGEMKNAMAVYARLKAILIEELGVEPGAEVTSVYRQCLLKRLESRRSNL